MRNAELGKKEGFMKLTREEKIILISIAVAAVAGLVITFLFSYNKKITEAPAATYARQVVDLNTATLEELDRLPGVGSVIAGRIIEFREKNNGFASVSQLRQIKGMTVKKMAEIQPYVSVSNQNPNSKFQNSK
jgi:competence protein ComEA